MNDNIIETPVKPTRTVEYYQSTSGDWHWRTRNIKNKKVVLTGAEGYSSKANVLRAINTETKNWSQQSFTGPFDVTGNV